MKRRIEQLVNGVYEYEMPQMTLSKKKIELSVNMGEHPRGNFTLENVRGKKMKGFIYASSPRVFYEPSDFYAIDEKINYEIDTTGMEPGEILSGEFTICSNIGEYSIPYEITIHRERGTDAPSFDIDVFAELAREDFQKAYIQFAGSHFRRELEKSQPEYLSLYDGVRGPSMNYQCMEEFLIGAGKKAPVMLEIDKTGVSFHNLKQSMKDVMVITKNTWGFLRIDITSDAPFLEIIHPIVTSDEFFGKTYQTEFVIHEEELHGGRNFGRITVKTPYQELTYEVQVTKARKDTSYRLNLNCQKQMNALYENYISFRLRRIDLNTWIRKSTNAINKYKDCGGKSSMIDLFLAQLYFAAEKNQEAIDILEKLESHRERINTPEIMGYYLYLTTFYKKDQEYIDYVEENVNNLFLKNQESWILQWILFYVQERMIQRPQNKLEAIERQFNQGCHSRIMYLEAYSVYVKSPLLLKRMGSFELQVLNFICRNGLLTRELIIQIADLTARTREFSRELYQVLCTAYEEYPYKGLLIAICSILIKGNRMGAGYFKWFARGVEEDIRLTGLYEAYLSSMSSEYTGALPQIIRMYFSYNNTLDYRKKAFVYANVIRNREEDEKTFRAYRPSMEEFMIDQLAMGHVNEDLSLIYSTFLDQSMLNQRIAVRLAGILFSREIICHAPGARSVAVVHKQLKQEQQVQLVNGKAVVQIYTEDYQLFIVDGQGHRHAGSLPYEVKMLMDNPFWLSYCQQMAPAHPGLVLHFCGKEGTNPHKITAENVKNFERLLEIEEVKESYKEQIRRELLDFYHQNQKLDSLYDFLKDMDLKKFIKADKRKLLELLTAEGFCGQAYELVCEYGYEQVDDLPLVRLCSNMITDKDYVSEEMLISVCAECFTRGKYDETILLYLLMYYDGPLDMMKAVWRAGQDFGLDTYDLEEKTLMFLMFIRQGAEDTEEIYDSYRKKQGKKILLHGYLNYRSYEYFVKDAPVKEPIFSIIEQRFEKEKYLDEASRLTLLKYYSKQKELSPQQLLNTQMLLEGYIHSGMRFAFFKDFQEEVIRIFGLSDTTFLEYRTNPRASVVVCYQIKKPDGSTLPIQTEPMNPLYEGIFGQEFVLFSGERLTYHFVEELDGKTTETREEIMQMRCISQTGSRNRYSKLNEIVESMAEGQEEKAKKQVKSYLELDGLAEELFTLQ